MEPFQAGVAPSPQNPPVLATSQLTDGMGSAPQVAAAPPPVNIQKLQTLGNRLASDFKIYEGHRRLAELRWERNLRQFIGEYDPDVDSKLDKNRSRAYPRLTRVKCVSMVSRLMNLLFPTTEKNWGIGASPVPNLSMQDLQSVLQQAQAGAQQAQRQLTQEIIEGAVRAFAATRAGNLEREIEDQLAEVGGSREKDYVALVRDVLYSGVLYGAGVLKGPYCRYQKQRRWDLSSGAPMPMEYNACRPHFDTVPVWDYYPDMTAKHLADVDGQFHRMVVSRSSLRALADRPDFFGEVVLQFLKMFPDGNWREKNYETVLRTLGVQNNVNVLSGKKYEIIAWDGIVDARTLQEANIELPQGYSNDMVDASIWMLGDKVIKADISPWVELESSQRVQMYHHFVFEKDDSSLLGNGLPNIMRDSQMGVCAATRMLMDNASIVCGPNLEVNRDLIDDTIGQDLTSIMPYKIWHRKGIGAEAQQRAVTNVEIPSHIEDLQKIVQMFEHFADMETFVNPATGGDMEKMPSEPMRSAAGASMIRGDQALPFRDAVRNFDQFTISVVNALILFNKHFNPQPELLGDFTPVARGSSSLIAKEMRGMALDMLSQSLTDDEKIYVNPYKLLMAKLKVRDVDVSDVVCDEDEAKQRQQGQEQQSQEDRENMKELFKAEIRKLLADATKSLTQSDKNVTASEVAVLNHILQGLESGVTPSDIGNVRAGAGIPAPVARTLRRISGKEPPPAATSGSSKGA